MQGGDYVLCGWRVASALPLPELTPWIGSADHPVDLTIAAGPVEPAEGDNWLTVHEDGTISLRIRDLVRILIVGGRHITVDILQPRDEMGWRLFVLGATIGYLCHQRGIFPLHAATVVIGARTVALAGESGAGKSTLAFALNRRGHRLLSDDLTVLREQGDQIEMLPAFPRLKLWNDTLVAMKEATDGLQRVRDGLDKFDLCQREGFDPAPRRLDAIFVLRKGDEPAIEPVPPAHAVSLIFANIVRRRVAERLGRKAVLFQETVSIARHVPVMRLIRPIDFAQLEETARMVEVAA